MAVQSVPGAPAHALPRAADTAASDALAALAGESARASSLHPLDGGLTNHNFRVELPDATTAVLRIPTGSDDALEIDRAAELRNARAAALAGVSPDVLAADGTGRSLVRWVEGRTLCPSDLDDSDMLARVAQTCRRLHAGQRFAGEFDMFAVQQRYLRAVRARALRVPDDYLEHAPTLSRIRAALGLRRPRTVPCHNDLLAANILDDGRIWFIDWEYSGNNDPAFELGNLWSEADLAEERLAELVAYYVGEPRPSAVARARLFAAVAQYGWTLWACIQDAVSTVDFDFTAWGRHRYDRAVALFRSTGLDTLLEAATSGSPTTGA